MSIFPPPADLAADLSAGLAADLSAGLRKPAASSAPKAVRKFHYDDFDEENEAETDRLAGQSEQPRFGIDDLNASRLAAEADGHARALAEAKASMEADTLRLLRAVLDQMAAFIEEHRQERDHIAGEAVNLAMQIARKVLPAFAATESGREIETFIAACFKERHEEPRLVVRLGDAMLDVIHSRLDALVSESGFTGKPVLLADPQLTRGEVRVEWANGGADWSFEANLAELEATARRLTAAPKAKKTPAKSPPKAASEPIVSEPASLHEDNPA